MRETWVKNKAKNNWTKYLGKRPVKALQSLPAGVGRIQIGARCSSGCWLNARKKLNI